MQPPEIYKYMRIWRIGDGYPKKKMAPNNDVERRARQLLRLHKRGSGTSLLVTDEQVGLAQSLKVNPEEFLKGETELLGLFEDEKKLLAWLKKFSEDARKVLEIRPEDHQDPSTPAQSGILARFMGSSPRDVRSKTDVFEGADNEHNEEDTFVDAKPGTSQSTTQTERDRNDTDDPFVSSSAGQDPSSSPAPEATASPETATQAAANIGRHTGNGNSETPTKKEKGTRDDPLVISSAEQTPIPASRATSSPGMNPKTETSTHSKNGGTKSPEGRDGAKQATAEDVTDGTGQDDGYTSGKIGGEPSGGPSGGKDESKKTNPSGIKSSGNQARVTDTSGAQEQDKEHGAPGDHKGAGAQNQNRKRSDASKAPEANERSVRGNSDPNITLTNKHKDGKDNAKSPASQGQKPVVTGTVGGTPQAGGSTIAAAAPTESVGAAGIGGAAGSATEKACSTNLHEWNHFDPYIWEEENGCDKEGYMVRPASFSRGLKEDNIPAPSRFKHLWHEVCDVEDDNEDIWGLLRGKTRKNSLVFELPGTGRSRLAIFPPGLYRGVEEIHFKKTSRAIPEVPYGDPRKLHGMAPVAPSEIAFSIGKGSQNKGDTFFIWHDGKGDERWYPKSTVGTAIGKGRAEQLATAYRPQWNLPAEKRDTAMPRPIFPTLTSQQPLLQQHTHPPQQAIPQQQTYPPHQAFPQQQPYPPQQAFPQQQPYPSQQAVLPHQQHPPRHLQPGYPPGIGDTPHSQGYQQNAFGPGQTPQNFQGNQPQYPPHYDYVYPPGPWAPYPPHQGVFLWPPSNTVPSGYPPPTQFQQQAPRPGAQQQGQLPKGKGVHFQPYPSPAQSNARGSMTPDPNAF